MSSLNTKNSATISDNMRKGNNNNVNAFSSNFNKCLNKYKYTKNNNNESNTINSQKNSNQNNQNISTSNKNNSRNQLNIYSFAEFEFFYNDSQNKNNISKQNSALSKTGTAKKNDNRNKRGIKPSQSYTSSNNNNSTTINNNNNTFKNNSPLNKILANRTTIDSNKYKNKRKSSIKKLDKNLSAQTIDHFLKNVKEYQKKKETSLNNLRIKSLEKEKAELKKIPTISKNSILLAKKKKRYPLYQKKPLNEEKNLDNNFRVFYGRNLYDNVKNTNTSKTPLNSRTIDEQFSKFYQSNLKWKKKIEEKNDKKRDINKNMAEAEYIENYSFKPILDKNSKNIMERKIRNNSDDYFVNDDLNDTEDDRELIEKLKIRLKPILSEYYINKNKKPFSNRRTRYLQRSKSDNNMQKKTYYNYNFKINPNSKNKNIKINYKIDEKKFKKEKKEKKGIKSEEKREKEEKKRKNQKKGSDKKEKEYFLLLKINELKKEKEKKKKELYKLNVCQGTAWNEDVVNSILPKQKCGHIIEGLL